MDNNNWTRTCTWNFYTGYVLINLPLSIFKLLFASSFVFIGFSMDCFCTRLEYAKVQLSIQQKCSIGSCNILSVRCDFCAIAMNVVAVIIPRTWFFSSCIQWILLTFECSTLLRYSEEFCAWNFTTNRIKYFPKSVKTFNYLLHEISSS